MPRKSGAVEAGSPAVPLSTDFCADDADVIIRAAGTLDFRVHKLILSLVSPVFKDMLTLPQPPTNTPNAIPHIDVVESAGTWGTVLRITYHLSNPPADDLGDLESLLLAAKKYEMQFILDSHQGIFRDRGFIQRDPLHLYAIACACGFEDQAKYVARNAEHLAVTRRANAGDLEGLTVTSYHRLVSFLAERDNRWHETLGKAFAGVCHCGGELTRVLYDEIREGLKRPSLRPEDIYLKALEDRSRIVKQACSFHAGCMMVDRQIDSFVKKMVQEREILCDKLLW